MWWDERGLMGCVPDRPHGRKLKAVVDLDCDYLRSLVLEGFSRRPEWVVQGRHSEEPGEDEAADLRNDLGGGPLLYWGEYERINWSAIERGDQHCNCYCIRKGLIRKAQFAHNLKKWSLKRPEGWIARSLPETHIMDVYHPDYLEEALYDVPEVRDMPMDGSEVWIAKPSITNQGLSVCIFNRVADLEQAVQQAEDIREWVIQRYITPPLLIHGHKFHLRAYALCVGSLAVYVYDEVLVLLAGEEYDAGLNRLDNLASHLTNTCQQDGLDGEEGEKKVIKLLSELPQLLSEGGLPICKAKERVAAVETAVRSIIGECLEAVSGELNFFTMPNCFELFGFDLMVDADWNCWVLEANAEPDFKQTGQRLRCIVDGLVEGVLRLVADPLAEEQGVRPPGEQEGVVGQGRWRKVLEKEQRPFFA